MVTKKKFLTILLIVQIIIIKIISFYPAAVERWYSNGLFILIARFSRIIFGWIPFSAGDIIYFIAGFLILRWLVKKFMKNESIEKRNWKNISLEILSFLSVFYFLFHLLWAINYHRVPLFEKMNIQREYSDADLLAFTTRLIKKTNEIHNQITDDSLKVRLPYSQQQVFDLNLNGYAKLSKQYPFFSYEQLSIKKSLISLPLTYMGFSGYLNPFTNEAQVNDMMPMYNFPTTATHEMAHQIGYASESEANFIGFLASIKNDDVYLKY